MGKSKSDYLQKMSDNELVLHCIKNNNNTAFGVLYTRHYQSVFRFLRNLTRNKATAEDLTQDVFMNIMICFQNKKYRGTTSFVSSYLKPFTYNIFLNYKRSIINKEKLSDYDSFFEDCLSESCTIQEEIIETEKRTQIDNLLSVLPPNKRNIIQLHIYENKVFNAIAFDLKTNCNTVKNQYFTGIEELRIVAQQSNFKFAI